MVIPFRSDAEVTAAIPEAVGHLVRQGLLGYPTETVYGLGSTVWEGAVHRLAELKGRRDGKPFLLLVAGREMLNDVGLRLTDAADRFASAFWPGPLTLVLPGGEGRLPDILRGPEGGIAVRWTSHAGVARLIGTLGSPITSTSANLPGEPAAMDPGELRRVFGAALDAGALRLLDAGRLATSAPSTVVDCTGVAPRLVRTGALDPAHLKAIVPALVEAR